MSYRYDRSIDSEHFNPASSQEKILMQIQPGSKVLECGCATGYMTRYMRDSMGCEVSIVEYDAEAYAVARQYASDGICADLTQPEWLAKFQGQRFDYILFADVLEHLYDPQAVLKSVIPLLKEGGSILASVPNIAHGDVLMNLWKGSWNYTETGLLDKTHIRFFAQNNLESFFQAAGLSIVRLDYTILPMGQTEQALSSSEAVNAELKVLNVLSQSKSSIVYQFIITAQPTEYVGQYPVEKEQPMQLCQTMATLYYSQGEGFSEEKTQKVFYTAPDFHQRFEWKSIRPTALRFDPVERQMCIVTSLQVLSNEGELEIYPANGYRMGHTDVFGTGDPQYSITVGDKGIEWIEIHAQIGLVSDGQIQSGMAQLARNCVELEEARYAQDLETQELRHREQELQEEVQGFRQATQALQQEIQGYQQAAQELRQEILEYQQETQELEEETQACKEQLLASRAYELELEQERERSLQTQKKLTQELAHIQTHYHAAIAQRNDLKWQLDQAQNAYNIISNAFFWKITGPLRWMMDVAKAVLRKNQFARLCWKGLKCWKENGSAYTWRKLQDKLHCRQESDDTQIMPFITPDEFRNEGGNVACLGPIPQEAVEQVYKHRIDIIIPVFNGFSYLERLLASIERTEVPYQLILVEDRSTDLRVLPFLRDYAGQHDNVIVLENETNLGFVRTTNRGLAYSEGHVAIVNTDVVLPEGWLERLMLPIVAGESVASSTPFTNSGTICSFPNFCQNNELFLKLDVQQIDDEFAKITPRYPIIPTGVGFCMGMSRKALDQVGLLDEETFGRGYGEENDWCRRAAEAGFVNVHTENLFVYHQHGASFTSEEKQALLKKNGEALLKKHPDYDRIVAEYCQADPCSLVREYVAGQLLRKDTRLYTVLTFNHSWGGGATAYLMRECRQTLKDGKRIVQVEYQWDKGDYQIEYMYGTETLKRSVSAANFSVLSAVLPERVDEIWANELVSYPKLFQVLEEIPALAKKHGARLLYLLHDYFALCPTVNLINTKGEFCGLPNLQSCEQCMRDNLRFREFHHEEKTAGMWVWRNRWMGFLAQCDEIRTFSNSSRELLTQAYEWLIPSVITVLPHKVDYLPELSVKKKRLNSFNIGVVGEIHDIKGLNVVKRMAEKVRAYGLKVRIVIIGETVPTIPAQLCLCTGRYERNMLPSIILEHDIDMILIPSIWPETFSYTTQESMMLGLPVACFDIGAPAERVAKYEKGVILPQINAESALDQLQEYAKENLPPFPEKQCSVLFIAEREDYASRYRVEHFREELLFCGVGSDFVLAREVRSIDFSRYDAVVAYRCSSVRDVAYLRQEADRVHIKLFFDIDDLVFDTEAVLQSCMSEEEKNGYLSKVDGYCINMRRADGLIASTDALAERMGRFFPDKPVCVRRNSASLEMETLSVCAGQNFSETGDEAVSLAYFSGSWTHDSDFAQITAPLLHIFQKYPKVTLKIYGCLNIPNQLESYRGRIEQHEFTEDWRSLPEKSAQAQIHLAPLENTLLNVCKSENKWMEAALAGRITVMSRLPELEQVVQNGETGFLCGTEEEWEETLSLLIESADQRNELAKKAQENVLHTHLTRNSGQEAAAFILERNDL